MVRHMPLPLLLISGIALASCDGTRLTPTAPSPAEALIGRFLLTLTAGADCAAIPDAAKTRRYLASIDVTGDEKYVVTLSDATFLTGPICTAGSARFAGVGCHQFFASRQDDVVQFDLANNNDEAHGGHIVEQLSLGTWLEIIGSGHRPASRVNDCGNGNGQPVVLPLSQVLPISVFRLCELFQRPAADIHAAVSRMRRLRGLHATRITRPALGWNARAATHGYRPLTNR